MNIKYDLTDINLSEPLKFNGELRDYQVGIVDEILEAGNNGVIKLGTGFGKTLIACEIIRKLNKTALIIVPRVSLLTQFKDTLKEFYNYEAGIIQGQTRIFKDITVASISSLKKGDIDKLSESSIVIMDEAHTAISNKRLGIIQSFNPKYLYALTATPARSDGQGDAIFFTFGKVLINKALPQEKPQVQIVKSDAEIEVSHEYHEMIDEMVENVNRNFLIARLAESEAENGRKILILTKRIEHYSNITRLIEGDYKIHCISSDMKQSERDELLTKLRNNEQVFDIILGTYSMLSTGVDIPALDTIIFAGDLKSDVLAEQSIGRILRIFKGKQHPKVIDIDDNLNGILHRQHLARRKFYKDNEWEII